MKKYILFLTVGLVACGKRQATTVDAPIPQEKIVRIFSDIHIIEAVINVSDIAKRDSIAQSLYSEVYATNGVSPDDFNKTLDMYMANPAAMNALYEKVIEQLTEDEAKSRAQ